MRFYFGKAVPKAVLSYYNEQLDLAFELRAKPVPPVQDSFIAYTCAKLMKQVFYVPQ